MVITSYKRKLWRNSVDRNYENEKITGRVNNKKTN